jgi:hypothetical protein
MNFLNEKIREEKEKLMMMKATAPAKRKKRKYTSLINNKERISIYLSI